VRRLPIHPGAIYGVAKELRAAGVDFRPIVVAGAEGAARDLVAGLTAEGDPKAIRDLSGSELSSYDVEGAGLLLYVIEGEQASEGDEQASEGDEQALRLADRKGVEAICILVGARSADPVDVPFVLATNVVQVEPGHILPMERILELLAQRADDRAYLWAARLPILRPAVAEQIVEKFSRQNGILGVAIFIPGADFPALTLNQIRMIFRIATAYGEQIDRDRALEARPRSRLGGERRRRVRGHAGARQGRRGLFREGRPARAEKSRPVRPAPVLACPRMSGEQMLSDHEALAIEEADAWFEYLEVTRAEIASGRYHEIEPWAWARLRQRLRAVKRKQAELRPAA
jgi:hypothetical protein